MTPMLLKIGTQPAQHYWVRGNLKINDIAVGSRLYFKPQKQSTYSWERGNVTGWCGSTTPIPMIDLG